MNKKGMSYTSIIFIMIALSIGMAIKYSQVDGGTILETMRIALDNSTTEINITTPTQPEIGNAVSYYATGMFSAMKELMIWTTKFVIVHPEAPYKLLFYGLVLSIFAPIIIVLFKFLVIVFLLVKEYLQNRREKKELKLIKDKI